MSPQSVPSMSIVVDHEVVVQSLRILICVDDEERQTGDGKTQNVPHLDASRLKRKQSAVGSVEKA